MITEYFGIQFEAIQFEAMIGINQLELD